MKRSILLFGILVAGSAFFTSCNKNLKDDVKSLRSQVDSLKKYNSELQEKMNGVQDAIGSNEPIKASTTFTGSDDKPHIIAANYAIKSNSTATHYMRKQENGTYEVYIERIGDVDWNTGAWIAFTYNPATKVVSELRAGQYWDAYDDYNHNIRYDANLSSVGLTNNLTINSIDMSTGDISLKYQGAGTAEYTAAIPNYYTPIRGKAVNTTLEFSGKLRVYNESVN